MKRNCIFVLFIISVLSFSCKSQYTNKIIEDNSISSEQLQYAKDFVFCQCVNARLDTETSRMLKKIDFSLGYYWDVYEGNPLFLDSIATAYAGRIEKSQINDLGEKIPLFSSCLRFYRSQELDSLIKNRPR